MPEQYSNTYVTHAEFGAFRSEFHTFRDDVMRGIEKLRDARQTNWSTVIAAVSLFIGMVALGAGVGALVQGGLQRQIDENAHELDIQWEQMFDQLTWNGAMEERSRWLENEIGRAAAGYSP